MKGTDSIFRLIAAVLLLFSIASTALSQPSLRDSSVNGVLLGISYGHQLPLADMEARFGSNGLVGAEISYKFRNNVTVGAEGNLMFGRSVNQAGFLDNLLDEHTGYFIGYNGLYGGVALFQRGYTASANVGKVFPAFGMNPNSGIYVRLGAGFMQHKIRITDTEDILYPLNGEYIKGYDRLTNGLMFTQYIGVLNLDARKLVNFHVGIVLQEGLTQNRRAWNFDERRAETEKRLDVLVGLRGTWILPFYANRHQRVYVN